MTETEEQIAVNYFTPGRERDIVISASVFSEHCHSQSLAPGFNFLVLPFSCWLIRIVPDKNQEGRKMDVCVCACVCVRACMRVCERACVSFLSMLPVAVAQSSSGIVVICHLLPVLWMTSYVHIIVQANYPAVCYWLHAV